MTCSVLTINDVTIRIKEVWLEQQYYSGDEDDQKMFHVDVHCMFMFGTDEVCAVFNVTSKEQMDHFGLDPSTRVHVSKQQLDKQVEDTTLDKIW